MIRTMINQIHSIALNTYRDAVRDRVVIIFSGFAVVLLLFSTLLGDMSVGGRDRVIQDMGFAVFGICGLLCIVYLGGSTIQRELQQKTVYMILSRPVGRNILILGKLAGINMVLFLLCTILLLVTGVVFISSGIRISSTMVFAYGFIWGEWILLSSISLFFSTFTTPLLHGFFLVSIYYLGHFARDLYTFSRNADSVVLKKVLLALYYGLPNLDSLNFRANALYGESVSAVTYASAAGILLLWLLFFTISAMLIFQKRHLR